MCTPPLALHTGRERQRHEKILVLARRETGESGDGDSYDRSLNVIETDNPSHRGRIGAEGPLPIAVIQNDDRRCGRDIIRRCQRTPHKCLHADSREVIARDVQATRDARWTVAAKVHLERTRERRHARKRVRVTAQSLKKRHRERAVGSTVAVRSCGRAL